jgi:hypothetical protein
MQFMQFVDTVGLLSLFRKQSNRKYEHATSFDSMSLGDVCEYENICREGEIDILISPPLDAVRMGVLHYLQGSEFSILVV